MNMGNMLRTSGPTSTWAVMDTAMGTSTLPARLVRDKGRKTPRAHAQDIVQMSGVEIIERSPRVQVLVGSQTNTNITARGPSYDPRTVRRDAASTWGAL